MKMVKENMIVYEALKNSVLHCEDGVRNARIYMYSVYFVVITFGVDHRWLFWVSFPVLIAFQAMINSDRLAVERISSYIRVFFENKRIDMHWSLLNKDEEHIAVYNSLCRNIGWYVNNAGASFLACISFLTINITNYTDSIFNKSPSIAWTKFIVASLLLGIVIYVNSRLLYIGGPKNKSIIAILDSSMEMFYQKCYFEQDDVDKEIIPWETKNT